MPANEPIPVPATPRKCTRLTVRGSIWASTRPLSSRPTEGVVDAAIFSIVRACLACLKLPRRALSLGLALLPGEGQAGTPVTAPGEERPKTQEQQRAADRQHGGGDRPLP